MDKNKIAAKELHTAIRKGARRKVYVGHIDEIHAVDLIEMEPTIGKQHKKYKYILTCIDVFSKYAWAIPLQNKSAISIINALGEIWKERKPEKIWSDHEAGLFSKRTQVVLKTYNIILYETMSELKSCVIERFNRTFKEKMEVIKTYYDLKKERYNWTKIYANVIIEYNNTVHSKVKMTPIEASRKTNEANIYRTVYAELFHELDKTKYELGQRTYMEK